MNKKKENDDRLRSLIKDVSIKMQTVFEEFLYVNMQEEENMSDVINLVLSSYINCIGNTLCSIALKTEGLSAKNKKKSIDHFNSFTIDLYTYAILALNKTTKH